MFFTIISLENIDVNENKMDCKQNVVYLNKICYNAKAVTFLKVMEDSELFMKIRRFICAILAINMLSLTSCGGKLSEGIDIVSDAIEEMRELEEEPSVIPALPPAPAAASTPEATAEPTPEPTAPPTPSPTPQTDSFLTGLEQASYLRYAPYSDLTTDELRAAFVKAAQKGTEIQLKATEDVSALCESILYGESANVNFLLQCSDIAGLTDAGMLNVFPDCNMQYRYLVDVNLFAQCWLKECVAFQGAVRPEGGDLIFWLDDEGRAVNYGIISTVEDEFISVIICRADGSRAAVEVNWANLGEKCTENAVVVHLVYPTNEQFVYLFCVNKMMLTPAAACGVMANIYRESSFRNYVKSGSSYGLCQWMGERRSNLSKWCRNNGLDYTTMYGQLSFMQYELMSDEKYLPLLEIMYTLGNTEQDAHDAAREWCYKYEMPANVGDIGYERGLSAKNDFYPIYSQY